VKHTRCLSSKVIALALLMATAASSAHAVVEAGHWKVSNGARPNQNPRSNLFIDMDQTVGGDYTGTMFAYDSAAGTLLFGARNADEGSLLFITRPGQVINDTTVAKLPAKDLLIPSATAAQVGRDFYIGGATESFSDAGYLADDKHWTVFGWLHLKADAAGKLQIVDSAMSFNEGGIVAGALPVPEAGTWSLMGLGLCGLALATRQKRRQATCSR